MIHPARIRVLKDAPIKSGPIVYRMSRDQRVADNWALLYAAELAKKHNTYVVVLFCLLPGFAGATWRQYDFMLQGLREVEANLHEHGIPFFVRVGHANKSIPEFLAETGAGALVTDFSPLRASQNLKCNLAKKITIPFYEVDAHNIVPCWHASNKQEFAARTFRPKILGKMTEFLEPFPLLKKQTAPLPNPINWKKIELSITLDKSVAPVEWITPGEIAARRALKNFITQKLSRYDETRNLPAQAGQSNLSPYFHFGQLAPARVVLEIKKHAASTPSATSFIEELVVRRELADNFCLYNKNYDSFAGFPVWAQKTLNDHRQNKRETIYTRDTLEKSQTHDDLWNAAQTEMVTRGKMHGYLRMYWAKKILEWTKNPEEALSIAIYLNDKYELDGRDPNGYVGIAWSIGGVHDRPWFARPIFGLVRYMSRESTGRKSKAADYIAKMSGNTLF